MKQLALLLIFSFTIKFVVAQGQLHQTTITLPPELGSSKTGFEFSSIARWNSNILLVPALKPDFIKNKPPVIYAISETELIHSNFTSKEPVKITEIKIDEASFSKHISAVWGYDGIEGTVVNGNDIFFTIETDGAKPAKNCHLAKGHITTKKGISTVFIDKAIPLKKDVQEDGQPIGNNSGYESLTYDATRNILIAVFEEKNRNGRLPFYEVNANLDSARISFFDGLPEDRLADICMDGDNLWGISSRYNSDTFCRSVLVKFDIIKRKIEEIGELAYNDCAYNWEGIISFAKGWLLISDNDNSKGKDIRNSRIVYCYIP